MAIILYGKHPWAKDVIEAEEHHDDHEDMDMLNGGHMEMDQEHVDTMFASAQNIFKTNIRCKLTCFIQPVLFFLFNLNAVGIWNDMYCHLNNSNWQLS